MEPIQPKEVSTFDRVFVSILFYIVHLAEAFVVGWFYGAKWGVAVVGIYVAMELIWHRWYQFVEVFYTQMIVDVVLEIFVLYTIWTKWSPLVAVCYLVMLCVFYHILLFGSDDE